MARNAEALFRERFTTDEVHEAFVGCLLAHLERAPVTA